MSNVADIKNIFDFKYKTEFILNNYNDTISDKLIDQNITLDSDIMSFNFETIELYMDNLYEKIRVLEDVMNYAELYINNELTEAINECKNLLKEIDNMNENLFEDWKSYININVPLINNDLSQYTDRDGSVIKTCYSSNGILALNGSTLVEYDIANVEVKTNAQIYETNHENILKNTAYRSHYLLDDIIDIGIIETLTMTFNELIEINCIDATLSNCKIIKVKFFYEDGNFEFIDDFVSNTFSSKKIKSVQVVLNSKNYKAIGNSSTDNTNNFIDNINQGNKFEKPIKDNILGDIVKGDDIEIIVPDNKDFQTIIDKEKYFKEYLNTNKFKSLLEDYIEKKYAPIIIDPQPPKELM